MKFKNKKTGEVIDWDCVCINSALLSAQNRKRLYWTNIGKIEQPEDKGILLKDIVHENTDCDREKSHAIIASIGRTTTREYFKKNYDKGHFRKLTPIECERLQTLPDNYTEGISNSQRYKCLGNGWTVDVIAQKEEE